MTTKTQNLVEKELTLKWIVADEKIIRFEDSDTVYDMADPVAAFDFKKAGVDKGTKVSVKIDTNASEHGTVVFMKKAGEPETKKETPKEESKASSTDKKLYTVAVIYAKTKGIKFEEEKDTWYTVSDNIGIGNLSKLGIEKGTIVEMQSEEPAEAGRNRIVTFIKKATDSSAPKTDADKSDSKQNNTTKTNYSKGNYSSDTQTSIEAQAAVNSACGLVGSMISGQSVDTLLSKIEDIKKLRKAFAEDNFRLIQDLKKNQA